MFCIDGSLFFFFLHGGGRTRARALSRALGDVYKTEFGLSPRLPRQYAQNDPQLSAHTHVAGSCGLWSPLSVRLSRPQHLLAAGSSSLLVQRVLRGQMPLRSLLIHKKGPALEPTPLLVRRGNEPKHTYTSISVHVACSQSLAPATSCWPVLHIMSCCQQALQLNVMR